MHRIQTCARERIAREPFAVSENTRLMTDGDLSPEENAPVLRLIPASS